MVRSGRKMMDSRWSNPLHLIAFEASRYLAEVFDRKALELEKAHPANFIIDESGYIH